MEDREESDVVDSSDFQFKALRSSSTRLRTDALKRIERDIEGTGT